MMTTNVPIVIGGAVFFSAKVRAVYAQEDGSIEVHTVGRDDRWQTIKNKTVTDFVRAYYEALDEHRAAHGGGRL